MRMRGRGQQRGPRRRGARSCRGRRRSRPPTPQNGSSRSAAASALRARRARRPCRARGPRGCARPGSGRGAGSSACCSVPSAYVIVHRRTRRVDAHQRGPRRERERERLRARVIDVQRMRRSPASGASPASRAIPRRRAFAQPSTEVEHVRRMRRRRSSASARTRRFSGRALGIPIVARTSSSG